MGKRAVEIEGFAALERKLKQLPDKVKKRELYKIMGQVANPTVKAMKAFAPKSSKKHFRYTGVTKGKRRHKDDIPADEKIELSPMNLSKSIGKIKGKKGFGKENPVLYVGPRSKGKKYDGYYGAMINYGTKFKTANPFAEKAFKATQGLVTADAEAKVAKYIEKQITRLSK